MDRSLRKALNVLRLKNIVPINCTATAHHPIRLGAHAKMRNLSFWFKELCGVFIASKYCRKAADVKNTEPIKKVKPS